MDKIKETQKNSPQSGKASEGSEETTPKADAKTYNQEELDKAIQKDRIARGRDAKSIELKEKSLTEREEALKKKEAEREADELEEAKKDPDKLAEYNAKKADRERSKSLDEREADLARSKAEHEAEIAAAKESQKEVTIWQVASAKNIEPMRLKNLSEKFNVEGKEKLEDLADEIASGTAETTERKVDSGVTSGGKESLEGKSTRQLFKEDFQDKQKKK